MIYQYRIHGNLTRPNIITVPFNLRISLTDYQSIKVNSLDLVNETVHICLAVIVFITLVIYTQYQYIIRRLQGYNRMRDIHIAIVFNCDIVIYIALLHNYYFVDLDIYYVRTTIILNEEIYLIKYTK